MFPDPDEIDRPTDHGVKLDATASTQAAGDPPPRWHPEQIRHTPMMIGYLAVPEWFVLAMYYWYIVVPLLVIMCSGLCTGAFLTVWWLTERVINAWIVS